MTQYRLSIPSMIAAVAAAAALGLPGMASAAYEHPANNEKGVIVHWSSPQPQRRFHVSGSTGFGSEASAVLISLTASGGTAIPPVMISAFETSSANLTLPSGFLALGVTLSVRRIGGYARHQLQRRRQHTGCGHGGAGQFLQHGSGDAVAA